MFTINVNKIYKSQMIRFPLNTGHEFQFIYVIGFAIGILHDGLIFLIMGSSKMIVWTLGLNRSAHLENFCKILWIIYIIIQIEIKNKQRAILLISYIEVTFLNLQHKIQLISFKTYNLLKTIGKLIFWYVFQTGTVRNKIMSNLIFLI